MKSTFKKVMAVVLTLVSSAAAMAGDWEPPTQPASMQPTSGDTVMIYNVKAGLYLKSGKINAPWESSTILGETGLYYRLDETTDDQGNACWTIMTASGNYAGKYMFAPTAEGDYPHCYNDMGGTWQGCHKWDIKELPNGNYTLSLIETHGMAIPGTYFGSDGTDNDLYFNINLEETPEGQIEWIFITSDLISAYMAKATLYETLIEAEAAGINTDEASAVYNNPEATAAEVNAAINALKSAMASSGFDPDASEDNPQDISDLLVNPTFDESVDGWENVGGMTWIASSYSGNNSEISSFCEKWTWNKNHTTHYEIYQTVNLPKGHYRLEADALATCQSDPSITVSGVSLYATAESDYRVAVATANNSPQHYTIDFMVDGSTATRIGFNCEETTTANWIAVDNFVLSYLGTTDVSEAYFRLSNAVASAVATYSEEDASVLDAKSSIRDAYIETLLAAQSTLETRDAEDAVYTEMQAKLEEALAALKASEADYKSLLSLMDKSYQLVEALYDNFDDLSDEVNALADEALEAYSTQEVGAEEISAFYERYYIYTDIKALLDLTLQKMEAYGDDEDLVGMIEEKQNEIKAGWHEGTYTTRESVAAAKEEFDQMVTEYVNARLVAGQDITEMIASNTFEELTGWNILSGTVKRADGVAEVYEETFDINQTIKNLPKGRYTLSVQGFQRTGWGLSNFGNTDKISFEMYANDNAIKMHHVGDFASPEGYYVDPEGGNGYPYDSYDDTHGYYPNSTAGAAAAFSSAPETYLNQMDFFLLDQPKTDVTIGLRATTKEGGWWCLFDNFKLIYQGNNASDYAEALKQLIAQINETIDGESITSDCETTINTAIANANEAIESNNADGCIASLTELKNTLAMAQETVAKLQKLMEEYSVIADYRMEEVVSSDTEFENTLGELVAALYSNSIKDLDEVDEWSKKLKVGFTNYVQHDGLETATEAEPFDITPVIYNYDGVDLLSGEYNTEGWEKTGNSAANEYGTEFYNNSFSISQTLYGLAPGYYKLHVQGFYRQGWPGQNVDTCANYVDIYAGAEHSHLLNIYDCWQDEPLGDETTKITVDTLGAVKYIPNSMAEAATYFSMDLYKNTVVFQVEEGTEEIVIGLDKPETLTGDWCIYDNWSLEYVGKTKPEEVSTDITSLTVGTPVQVSFFGIDGKQNNRLQRGVNIIRLTDAQGNTQVKKVIVK